MKPHYQLNQQTGVAAYIQEEPGLKISQVTSYPD
jgi:hypothetical protein